ncbi:flagellar protein FlgN [bacterium]|nr:flagellar protein FlgN [bacterium]
MDDSFLQLKNILSEELSLYRHILVLSEKKQKLLLERFSTDLLQIVADEEEAVQKLASFEGERQSLIEKISHQPGDSSLEDFVNSFVKNDTEKTVFFLLKRDLNDVITRIKEINERNQKLLEQALDLTRYSLGLVTTPPREVIYHRPDTKKVSPSYPSLIDRKI